MPSDSEAPALHPELRKLGTAPALGTSSGGSCAKQATLKDKNKNALTTARGTKLLVRSDFAHSM
jgi:hypothetical protein